MKPQKSKSCLYKRDYPNDNFCKDCDGYYNQCSMRDGYETECFEELVTERLKLRNISVLENQLRQDSEGIFMLDWKGNLI